MQSQDLSILEMFGWIYEDLDIDKIENKFVDLVSSVFGFDRVALFFVKHKKEMLAGKLSRGFDPEVVRNMEIPIRGDSEFVKPLITGSAFRSEGNGQASGGPLALRRFALIPIVAKKRAACWEIKNCAVQDCPVHGKRWMRCWLMPGTKCGGSVQCTPAEKAAQCSGCPIFTDQGAVDAVEGVMVVDNSHSRKPITDDMITILSIIAHTVGMAINNSKLYQKTLDVSIRDALTNLYNRRYFNERLLDEVERARRYVEPLSLIICDIDHFKRVNDTYGHPVGDQILRWVADALRVNLRKIDVISRYGGEEFAVILVNTDKESSVSLAEKLRGAIQEEPFRWDGKNDIRISVSFGVAAVGPECRSFDSLIVSADKALYRAKATGRNRVCAL